MILGVEGRFRNVVDPRISTPVPKVVDSHDAVDTAVDSDDRD
jgi:hypothetical protein